MLLDRHHHTRESRRRSTLKDSNNECSTAKLDLAKNSTKARPDQKFERRLVTETKEISDTESPNKWDLVYLNTISLNQHLRVNDLCQNFNLLWKYIIFITVKFGKILKKIFVILNTYLFLHSNLKGFLDEKWKIALDYVNSNNIWQFNHFLNLVKN